eukprot:scaffold100635_cov14-Tisochrysis_lutea.AAC.1
MHAPTEPHAAKTTVHTQIDEYTYWQMDIQTRSTLTLQWGCPLECGARKSEGCRGSLRRWPAPPQSPPQ